MPVTRKYPNCQQTTYAHPSYHNELVRHQVDTYDDGPHQEGTNRRSNAKTFRDVLRTQINKPTRV